MELKKLGFFGITAIVFGSMIGAGIFNIPQNMACGAGLGAVALAWIITALGMLLLAFSFKILSDRRPDLNAGIYQYAQKGFGNYVGFNIAWGYWLCAAFGNVAYAVMLNDSIGVFFPSLLEHGPAAFIFGSCLIWLMCYIASRGIRSASSINIAITLMKITALVLICVILVLFFKLDLALSDVWGMLNFEGDVTGQIKHTMLVTLWCFLGIEGAVVMSARAKRPKDVGRAGLLGFLLAWVLYVAVSMLSYGVMQPQQMGELPTPSVAYLLREVCGEWAYYFVVIAIICSLAGGWISWTLLCAQVPYEAAGVKILPRQFLKLNRHGMPLYSLVVSSVVMQIFYFGVIMADSVYMAAIEVAGMMVIPAYFFCGAYLFKASLGRGEELRIDSRRQLVAYRVIGMLCMLYCLWLMYAGGLDLLLTTSLFYLPGIIFYRMARRQHAAEGVAQSFSGKERIAFSAICCCAVVAAIMMVQR